MSLSKDDLKFFGTREFEQRFLQNSVTQELGHDLGGDQGTGLIARIVSRLDDHDSLIQVLGQRLDFLDLLIRCGQSEMLEESLTENRHTEDTSSKVPYSNVANSLRNQGKAWSSSAGNYAFNIQDPAMESLNTARAALQWTKTY